ncbi:hypothetical protein GGTG_03129 [Gaeumannomyces tritici R3-111a-1]|uniref:Uncharacterized protein n=1 Tax=Gaeumannomyces tritici (strain R3-111a-1) TaxID=644352 RepID=J3NPC1_GAET3|nr:hypothetical protein GGTG_03129 [Gaeumannomyces tritici R3-111a-1]EJT78026.1 hypothetical protein GGTG_03129 [Gaeumannomyces tritici R3-111a-1]
MAQEWDYAIVISPPTSLPALPGNGIRWKPPVGEPPLIFWTEETALGPEKSLLTPCSILTMTNEDMANFCIHANDTIPRVVDYAN